LRPDLIGPGRDLGERRCVLDGQQLADLARCRRLKILLGDLGDDAMAFRAPRESGRPHAEEKEQRSRDRSARSRYQKW
jgi:hypothetical protein